MKSNLIKRGFLSLLVTQFLGATNDNILKQVIIYMVTAGLWAGGRLGESAVAVIFMLPFIVLSGYAGQFADRNSKQWVTVLLKILEIPIATVAFIGLWTQSLTTTILALVLLSIHSTFFGPAKYGMIPELVSERDLSRANGLLNMLTNIAVIVGTLLAGPLSDQYYPTKPDSSGSIPEPDHWLPGAVLIVVAVLGLGAALFLPRLTARDPKLRYNPNPLSTYVAAVREMAKGPLLMVAIAWSYFYLIASIALLILPNYKDVLGITFTMNSYLLGALGVAIGVGSVLAGLISGHRIEPRLIPVGAVGMSVMFLLLGIVTPEYWTVGGLLVVAGIFAGFYIIPLQALLQKLSPADERGRFLGTANAISSVAFMFGALVEWLAKDRFGMPPNRIFLVVAGVSLLGTGAMLWRLRGYLRPGAIKS